MNIPGRASHFSSKGVSAGYALLILLLGFPLITPLLRLSTNPCTHDGHVHFHRIAALRHAWESGLYFSRWLPDVSFGYGYPLFLFREAVPLYATLFPNLLGLPLPASINLFYIITILAAGLFMFLWVTDLFGPAAGLVSAVVYMAAPYQLIDALIRGTQQESMALALLPLVAWLGRRYVIRGSVGYFLFATLSLTLLSLSHNISTLLFVPALFLYLVLVGWSERLSWQKLALRLLLLFGLGLALSAFYLGPALVELDEITISQAVSRRGNNFQFNFSSLGEIFSPVTPSDPNLINPPLNIRLGLVSSGLAFLGAICVVWVRSREQRSHIIFMSFGMFLLLFMSLPVSSLLWDSLPLIKFVQFPWRFIGRAALPVAFLAGIPFAVLPQKLPRKRSSRILSQFFTILLLILALLEAIPYLYPPACPVEANPTINEVHTYEHETGFIGVDPEGSHFPKSVFTKPTQSALEADYLVGLEPKRFDDTVLPQGASISDIVYGPTSVSAVTHSPTPFQARYLTYDFPGWVAMVDGQQVPITPSVPEGLITFTIPAGEHAVEVLWQGTPTRQAFTLLSLAALFAISVTALLMICKKPPDWETVGATTNSRDMEQPVNGAVRGMARKGPPISILLFLLVAIGFLAVKLLVFDRDETPFRHPAAPQVDHPITLTAAELGLEGFNLDKVQVASGETFDIDLAWRTVDWPAANYQSNIWLVDPRGLTWSDKETERPRVYEDPPPTSFWQPGRWAWDSREVAVLHGTPPGKYDIVLTVFDLANLQPLTLLGPDNNVLGPTTIIGQIQVVVPTRQPDFNGQIPLQETVAGLTLFGYNQDREQASPGDPLLLTFFWENNPQAEPQDTPLTLTLVSEDGQVVQDWHLMPGGPSYPAGSWSKGEQVRSQDVLRLPAGLASGLYQFYLEDIPLGRLEVEAPERVFDKPEDMLPAGANFGDLVTLAGYSFETDGAAAEMPVTVSLVWQALAEMTVSYRVFVHLIDDAGQIIAQSDAEPAGWLRPTTGWSPGEYVADKHMLAVPEGVALQNLALRIGLYDAESGRRLETDGLEYITIPFAPD